MCYDNKNTNHLSLKKTIQNHGKKNTSMTKKKPDTELRRIKTFCQLVKMIKKNTRQVSNTFSNTH